MVLIASLRYYYPMEKFTINAFTLLLLSCIIKAEVEDKIRGAIKDSKDTDRIERLEKWLSEI